MATSDTFEIRALEKERSLIIKALEGHRDFYRNHPADPHGIANAVIASLSCVIESLHGVSR